jgi:hypothetical protein
LQDWKERDFDKRFEKLIKKQVRKHKFMGDAGRMEEAERQFRNFYNVELE